MTLTFTNISIERVGLCYGRNLTIRGLEYAISKGVKEIEINKHTLSKRILVLDYNVKVIGTKCAWYMDGSLNEDTLLSD